MKKTFAIIGLGYIAERHLKAIRDVDGELVAAHDITDSVGILDKYFPYASFFTDKSLFDEYVRGVDYYVICTPNYQHFGNIKTGVLYSKNIICEKPVVFDLTEYDFLKNAYTNIFQILQYRALPEVINLKESINGFCYCEIDCNTYRGDWYGKSWKGKPNLSGGLVFNIGIHLLDLMSFLFGNHVEIFVEKKTNTELRFKILYQDAEVFCDLSIDKPDPKRIVKVNDQEIDLNGGFQNSHTAVYKHIVNENWYSLEDTQDAFNMAYEISKYEA